MDCMNNLIFETYPHEFYAAIMVFYQISGSLMGGWGLNHNPHWLITYLYFYMDSALNTVCVVIMQLINDGEK